MIYTRFGSPAKVLRGNLQNGHVDILCTFADGTEGEYQTWLNELRADGGFAEIAQAIDQANKERKAKKQ